MNKNDYEIVVGLEVHAELSTESKSFAAVRINLGWKLIVKKNLSDLFRYAGHFADLE